MLASIIVTKHGKTGLMYTKYISLYYGTYLLYCLSSVNCFRFPIKCCINGENVIRLLFLSAKLLKFEIQKCGQILCAHKPYFLMPGHNLRNLGRFWVGHDASNTLQLSSNDFVHVSGGCD